MALAVVSWLLFPSVFKSFKKNLEAILHTLILRPFLDGRNFYWMCCCYQKSLPKFLNPKSCMAFLIV